MPNNPVHVVFQHEHFIIVNKPMGVGVHREDDALGIIDLVKQQSDIEKLWLIHRLDKVTSGLLILALNAQAAAELSSLFAQRKVQKYYLAISDKKPKKKQGAIIGDMEKSRNGTFKLNKSKHSPAITQFFSKGLVTNDATGKRLFVLKPKTGKTHQLRVALKSLGSPILGDTQYTGTKSDRVYLHAYALQFNYLDKSIEVCHSPDAGEHFVNNAYSTSLGEFATPWHLDWPDLK